MIADTAGDYILEFGRRLQAIGYTNGLLQQNYQFADYVGPGLGAEVRTIHLAAFGQEPLTAKTASIGVVVGSLTTDDLLQYRALGAPQIFTVSDRSVARWKILAEGAPIRLETIAPDRLLETIQEKAEEWGPHAVLRAKAVSFSQPPIQLDFFDTDLVPAVERVVRRKLNELLNRVVAGIVKEYEARHGSEPDPEQLYRLIFRLLSAKLLADRQHSGHDWLSGTATEVIERVEQFYLSDQWAEIPPALADQAARTFAWHEILRGFHLQNISLDTLAWIWENSFVTPAIRDELGIYGTPPAVAEYIVRRLPFESIPLDQLRVFEPCMGQAVFLVAALGRIRELILAEQPDLGSAARHDRFVQMLSGLEIDGFATEIARLSLMLADYPHPAGWSLHRGNVFQDDLVTRLTEGSTVVLCNPPFGRFPKGEQPPEGESVSHDRAAEVLKRVLKAPPRLLGVVLPRLFRDGLVFRQARRTIAESYATIEVTELPDTVFGTSDAESVLVIAYGRPDQQAILQAKTVHPKDVAHFLRTGEASSVRQTEVTPDDAEKALWIHELDSVWAALANYPRLDSIAVPRIGIQEENIGREAREPLVSAVPHPGTHPGVHRVSVDFEPFFVGTVKHFKLDPTLIRKQAHRLPWHLPKVLVNRNRRTRRAWTLTAVPDFSGLVASMNFQGVWPTTSVPVEVIAAILNGHVANAWVDAQEEKRHSGRGAVASVPIPHLSDTTIRRLTDLVSVYRTERAEHVVNPSAVRARRCLALLEEIDAVVLAAYQLPRELERQLLQHFADQQRPGTRELVQHVNVDSRGTLPLFGTEEIDEGSVGLDDMAIEHTVDEDAALKADIVRLEERLRLDRPDLFDSSGALRPEEARRILRERAAKKEAATRAALLALTERSGGRSPDAT